MSNWIPITLDTLNEASIAVLITACDSAALANSEANRSPGLIQGVVDDIRRKVASCRFNQLDADQTRIPKGLKTIAVTLIIARLKGALEIALTEDQQRDVAQAYKNLDRVASCTDVVDQPDNAIPAPMEPTVAPPSFGTRGVDKPRRLFTDCTQDG